MPCMEGWDVFLWNIHAVANRGNRAWHSVSVVSVEQPGNENMTSACRMGFCPFRELICFPSQCLWCWHPWTRHWRSCSSGGMAGATIRPGTAALMGSLGTAGVKDFLELNAATWKCLVTLRIRFLHSHWYLLSGEWSILPAQVCGYPDNSWSCY